MRKVLYHIFMILICLLMSFPFIWMILSSLKEQYDVLKVPPVWIPPDIKWQNYVDLFTEQPTLSFLFNSIKISVSVVVGQLAFSSLAGYAFARFRFKGRDALFLLYIGTLMIPVQVTLIPLYLAVSQLGWLDTHWPLIIPGFFSAFGVFLLRQFFSVLPVELEEAAELDGCNPLQTFYRIMLPQIKPALATLGVFTCMGSWNDLLGPLIFLSTPDKYTITIGITFFQGLYVSKWNLIMAGGVVSILPILGFYFLAQSYFERGIVMSGVKG